MEPIILEGLSLLDYVHLILSEHAIPSTLVVCCTRNAFLQQLHHHATRWPAEGPRCPILSRTIRLLSQARTLDVAFCPSLEHLRAYLSQDQAAVPATRAGSGDGGKTVPVLAIVNLLGLHRETAAWSAQGLGRTFAVAVEAAQRAGQKLVIAEPGDWLDLDAQEGGSQRSGVEDVRVDLEGERDEAAEAQLATQSEQHAGMSVWDEEVAILNVSTRSFGAGERGWVGRTVRVRKVAARWCIFCRAGSETGLLSR